VDDGFVEFFDNGVETSDVCFINIQSAETRNVNRGQLTVKGNVDVFWRNDFGEDALFVGIQDELFDLAGTPGGCTVGIETTEDCIGLLFYGFFLFAFGITVGDEPAD
jgi:hypothetical protein